MGKRIKELKMISFMKKHKDEINLLQKTFVNLFNECSKRYNDNSMQLALMGGIVSMFIKNTNAPNEEVKKLHENISKKLK